MCSRVEEYGAKIQGAFQGVAVDVQKRKILQKYSSVSRELFSSPRVGRNSDPNENLNKDRAERLKVPQGLIPLRTNKARCLYVKSTPYLHGDL